MGAFWRPFAGHFGYFEVSWDLFKQIGGPKVAQMGPRGAQEVSKGSPRGGQNGAKDAWREAKRLPEASKNDKKTKLYLQSVLGRQKGGYVLTLGCLLGSILLQSDKKRPTGIPKGSQKLPKTTKNR